MNYVWLNFYNNYKPEKNLHSLNKLILDEKISSKKVNFIFLKFSWNMTAFLLLSFQQ